MARVGSLGRRWTVKAKSEDRESEINDEKIRIRILNNVLVAPPVPAPLPPQAKARCGGPRQSHVSNVDYGILQPLRPCGLASWTTRMDIYHIYHILARLCSGRKGLLRPRYEYGMFAAQRREYRLASAHIFGHDGEPP